MKEYLGDLLRRAVPNQARNVAREYLQARILESLQRSGAMIPLAFFGGQCRRPVNAREPVASVRIDPF